MDKKLSIIIPVFNHSDLTLQLLQAINKSVSVWETEVIIVDDWSTDDTMEIVQKASEDLPNLTYIKHSQNEWVTKSRNDGVEKATWKYICVMNNDTLIFQWFMEKLIDGFKDDPTIWIVCWRFTEWPKAWDGICYYYKEMINGSCFMIKYDDKFKLFPLDERLKIRWSDNRLYYKNKELWKKTKIIRNAVFHHFGHQTVNWMHNDEKEKFFEIAKENGREAKETETIPQDPMEDVVF